MRLTTHYYSKVLPPPPTVSAGPNNGRPRTPRRARSSTKSPRRQGRSPRAPRPRAREREYYVTDYNKPLPNAPRTYEKVKRKDSTYSLKTKTLANAKTAQDQIKLQLCKPLPIAVIVIMFIVIIAVSSGNDKISAILPISDKESFFPKPSLAVQTKRCPGLLPSEDFA